MGCFDHEIWNPDCSSTDAITHIAKFVQDGPSIEAMGECLKIAFQSPQDSVAVHDSESSS